MKLDFWSTSQELSTSYTTVYEQTSCHMVEFYGFVFHASSDQIVLKLTYPGVTWEIGLDEVEHDYGLDVPGSMQVPRWIYSIGNKRFVVEFPVPVRPQGDFSVAMKAVSGAKTLYRGFTVRGAS